jgi:nitrite reductase (NADH) small subunit
MNMVAQNIKANWVAVGTVDDIPQRGARCVKNGAMTIAIFRTASNEIYALEDRCPHKNGPLSQGIVHDGCVTCPLHNWVISLSTGKAQGADDGATLAFPVKVDGQIIYLDLAAKVIA